MHHGHREGTRVQHRCSKRFGEGNRLGADGAPSPRGELGATGEVEIPRRGTRGTGAPRTWLLWAKLVNRALPIRGPPAVARWRPRREIRRSGSLIHEGVDRYQEHAVGARALYEHGAAHCRCSWDRLCHQGSAIDILRELATQGALHKAWSGRCAFRTPARSWARQEGGGGKRRDVIGGETGG
jgi:hypothetical protein